jgi:membrane protein YdbS with pleckstrin-like domain
MIATLILAPFLTILGIVILRGKGDELIAGYNTASKEEREKCNVKRLRLVVGVLSFVIALASLLFIAEESLAAHLAFGLIVAVAIIVTLVLANTWAMKK